MKLFLGILLALLVGTTFFTGYRLGENKAVQDSDHLTNDHMRLAMTLPTSDGEVWAIGASPAQCQLSAVKMKVNGAR